MPSRPKRRAPLDRVYTSEPNARQVHFPCQKRSINPAKPTPPTSRTRQQTLTQIDFVTRYVPPDEDVDLNYIEEEEEVPARRKRRRILPDEAAPMAVRETDSSKRKRRKTLPAPGTATAVAEDKSAERRQRRTLPVEDTPTTIETRASKRQKIKQEPESENNATSTPRGTQSNAADIQPRPVRGEMNTPRTPVTARKVEIPSSQSPADSPLSTQKTASFPSPVRSPLRARSTNMRAPLNAGLKGRKLTGWHPKLEVKSSVSWENEDSQPLTVAPYLRTAEQRDYDLDRWDTLKGVEGGQEGKKRPQGAVPGPIRSEGPPNRSTPTPLPLTTRSSKTEIRDSDDEEEEDEDEDGRSPHSTTNRTQTLEHESSQFQHPLLSTSNTKSLCQAPTPSTDAPNSSSEHSHAEPSAPSENPTSSSCEPKPKPKDKDDNTPTNRNISSPINTILPPLSSAEAASAQLFNDLHQETQNQLEPEHEEHTEGLDPLTPTSRLLDSQSQFGFICRDYTPSPSRSPPSISPIPTTLHEPELEPKPKPNATSFSGSRSSSPTIHPGKSQILTQSPLLSRSLPHTSFPGPPPKPPHLQTSQISTQSQSQSPRKPSILPAPPPQHPQHPQSQHRPSFEPWPSFSIANSELALPPLPRQDADVQPEDVQEQAISSACPSEPDADADFLPPQTFLQSSPLLAPSLSIYDYEREGDKFGDGDVTDDERAEVGGDGGGSWDGNVKTTSQFLPESMFDDKSQGLGLRLPPGFSSQFLEQE